jgi:hypothetical protein
MKQRSSKQAGVVSIMVTLIMIIVITLIVLGFAEISRNEQRSSLDDQLSAQAYYAAESGINDARAIIDADVKAGTSVPGKTICGDQNGYNFNSSGNDTVDATHNVSYTCVLINAAPSTLVYDVGYTSTVVPIISSGPAIGTLTLTWQVANGLSQTSTGCYTNIGSLDTFPVASGSGVWGCNYPLVRVDALDANGALSRPNWSSNTATMFLVPFDSLAVSNDTTLADRGTAVPARCNASSCQVNITGLTGTKYYLRITTLYHTNAKLTITASGPGVTFVNAQATIDATGKAQDVLRRVLVAVDLTDANAANIPSAAIISEDSVCKRYGTTNASFTVYDDMSAGGGGNTLCTTQSSGSPIP